MLLKYLHQWSQQVSHEADVNARDEHVTAVQYLHQWPQQVSHEAKANAMARDEHVAAVFTPQERPAKADLKKTAKTSQHQLKTN